MIAAMACGGLTFSESCPADIIASYIYGIDDANNIWQVTLSGTGNRNDRVFLTGLPGTGNSNAFAYDTVRDEMFFMNSGTNATPTLYYWNRQSAVAPVATKAQLGNPSTLPANAAYYDNAFWFFSEGTSSLNKVSLSYSGTVPSFQSLTTYTVSGIPTPGTDNRFGDIAINNTDGVLYAASTTGLFYSVSLGTLVTNGSATATVIKNAGTGNPSLQIAFSPDYTTLYATNYAGGAWYTVDTSSGSLTTIPGFTSQLSGTNGFRDLGGSSFVAVPEPSTLVSAAAALGTLAFAFGRRRRAP